MVDHLGDRGDDVAAVNAVGLLLLDSVHVDGVDLALDLSGWCEVEQASRLPGHWWHLDRLRYVQIAFCV